MQILFVSDIHAALRLPHAKLSPDGTTSDRLGDVIALLYWLRDTADAHNAEAIAVLGDLFHEQNPDVPTLTRVSHALREMAELRPLWLLPGNHDAHGRSGRLYSLELFDCLHVPGIRVFTAADTAFDVAGVLPGALYGQLIFEPVAWRPDEAQEEALRNWSRAAGGYVVGLLHQNIAGATDAGRAVPRGISQETLAECFDLVLSGHIHTPQRLAGCNGVYLGSPMEYRFSEDDGHERGAWLFDTEDHGLELIPYTESPKFVRWRLQGDGDGDLVDVVDSELAELSAELSELLERRPAYLEVVATGPRAEIDKVRPLVEEAIPAGLRAARRSWRATDEGAKRIRTLAARSLATAETLVETYVAAEEATLTAELDAAELIDLGRELLQ